MNPYSENYIKIVEKTLIDSNGELYDYKEKMREVFSKCPNLLEIHNLFSDFCLYLTFKKSEEEIKFHLERIILRALDSTEYNIQKVGESLLEFCNEIVNLFSLKNVFKLTNSIAETNNNRIQKIISVSYGCKNFKRFRKRILYIEAKKMED